jgi:uncharacterized Tic20 family protein
MMTIAELMWYFFLAIGFAALVGGLVVWWLGETRRVGSRLGFNTRQTLRYPEVWVYTNRIYGILFVIIGFAVLVVSIAFNAPLRSSAQLTSYFALSIAGAIILAYTAVVFLSIRKARAVRRAKAGRPTVMS